MYGPLGKILLDSTEYGGGDFAEQAPAETDFEAIEVRQVAPNTRQFPLDYRCAYVLL